jgi:hypothetical protein
VLEDIVAFEAAYFAITASVLDDIPWLLLVLTYCITKLITTWLATGSLFWESGMSNQGFGLGQITALILLVIPILTLCDTIAEQFGKDNESKKDDKQTAHWKGESVRREVEVQEFSNNRAFRVSIIILSLLRFVSFILVAVITAVPWYIFAWNLGATVPFATLFVWAILLEVCHVCYTFALRIGGWIAAAYNFWRYLVDIAYPSLIKLRKPRGAASSVTDFA